MKRVSLILGLILLLSGLFQGANYFLKNEISTEFQQGFLLGSALLIVLGGLFVYWGVKSKKEE